MRRLDERAVAEVAKTFGFLSSQPKVLATSATSNGFSLLELLLALAIFGSAMAVLAQTIGVAADAAVEARDLSAASLLAQSKLTELLIAGVAPVATPDVPVAPVDSSSDTPMSVRVDVGPGPTAGLINVSVTVTAGSTTGAATGSVTLTRWMIDPSLELDAAAAEEAAILVGQTEPIDG